MAGTTLNTVKDVRKWLASTRREAVKMLDALDETNEAICETAIHMMIDASDEADEDLRQRIERF